MLIRRDSTTAWYEIRDTLLGQNCVKPDINKALELASVCEHPNAVWLTKLFGGRVVGAPKEAKEVFLEKKEDKRALCFAALCDDFVVDEAMIRRAAELGDAFAQAWMAGGPLVGEVDGCRWAEKSAAQGERDGFFQLALCFSEGIGCDEDLEKAKENYLLAAEVGHVDAMGYYATFRTSEPEQFVWLARMTAVGVAQDFLDAMKDHFRFLGIREYPRVLFAMGRALDGHINIEMQTVFGVPARSLFGYANHALQFYKFQLQSYRRAVNSWTVVALRNCVVKDIRKMIGHMIWESKEQAKYQFECSCPVCAGKVPLSDNEEDMPLSDNEEDRSTSDSS
jgi:hypothetical protein